ncbi:MAG: hypothetical protein HY881_10615 [Deltaproteobacteria bacterium]|nr:hypothetical protein [Deltaproteobacteria bacterium]
MLDISVAYNRYKFVGNEFLTWMWYVIEHDPAQLNHVTQENINFTIGNRIMLQNAVHDAVETITIKGDDAGLEEGVLALKKGALVTEIHLRVTEAENEWQFTLKGESLNISNLRLPETGQIENRDDIEGAVLEKFFLYEKIMGWLDAVYGFFVKIRLSPEWNEIVVPRIKKWILQ